MRLFKTFLIPFIFPVHLWSEIPEMILGEETIENGINLVFEVAIKDDVSPSNFFGNEENSDIHLEVLSWTLRASPCTLRPATRSWRPQP